MIQLFPFLLVPLTLILGLGFAAAFAWLAAGVVKGVPIHSSAGPLAIMAVAYAVLLGAGSAMSAERRVPLGTLLCFDDWCVAINNVREMSSSANRTVSADVRVVSDAKRVTQRPSNPRVYFIDDRGHWYAGKNSAGTPPMNRPIAPGESFSTRVQAAVPPSAKIVAVRVWEGGWLDRLVPFDEESPFHGKTFYNVN